ncbi:MAG: hypothetical protein ACKOD1_02345, partial [Sphingomonadales bacterium]
MKVSVNNPAMGWLMVCAIGLLTPACKNNAVKKEPVQWPAGIAAPVAIQKEKALTAHGDTRIDEYY